MFLSEPDEAQRVQNVLAREPAQGEQTFRAGMSVRVGHWLATGARELELPVVTSRPWTTIFKGVLAALNLTNVTGADQPG